MFEAQFLTSNNDKSVKCLRLENGDTIIGFVSENKFFGKTTYTIEDTHACIVQVDGGNMEVGLAPWLPYAKDYTFQIKGIRVVTTFEPRPQLETNFRVLIGKQRGK
mgnify:FL=1